jgi:AcrR family transcriptional regulator
VTRATFYRHFPSKDDLVLAYLDRRGQRARAAVQAIVDNHPGDPCGALHAWAVAFAEDGQIDEYRGCTFINAAAEYGRPDHPVRLMAIAQRRWINQTTEALLREAGHPDPVAAARILQALRTGYVFSTGLEEDAGWAGQFLAAHDRIARTGPLQALLGQPGQARLGDLAPAGVDGEGVTPVELRQVGDGV